MFHLETPWESQKAKDFLMYLWVIAMEAWDKYLNN